MPVVITKVPNPEKGEPGNLFCGLTDIFMNIEEPSDKNGWLGISIPFYKHPTFIASGLDALSFQLENFRLGEILVLDHNDRDLWGRKPSKWLVETEYFETWEEAYKRAVEVVQDKQKEEELND